MASEKTDNVSTGVASDPLQNPRQYRSCLGLFATGVTVVTTKYQDELYGVTANSFASVSMDPPLVLWSIAKSSRSCQAFQGCDFFTINILSESQIELSQHFSRYSEDKFSDVRWESGIGGTPVLDGALGVLNCSVETRHDGGDHVIMIGRVKSFTRNDGSPLVYAASRYAIAVDHPDIVSRTTVPDEFDATVEESSFFMTLFQAYHAEVKLFAKHRQQANASYAQSKVLVGLNQSNKGLTLDSLQENMMLTSTDAADAVAELMSRGELVDVDGSLVLTEKGNTHRERISRCEAEFERETIARLGEENVRVVKQILKKLI